MQQKAPRRCILQRKKLNIHGMLFASALAKPGLIYFCLQEAQGREGSFKGYKLMTSVSIPVYNKKNHTVSEANPLLLLHQQWPQSVYQFMFTFCSSQSNISKAAPPPMSTQFHSPYLFRPLKCWDLSQMKLQTRLGRFGKS